MQCSEESVRLSRGAILSRPQRRQADSQRPRELCLTNPQRAPKTDERIVGAIELPDPDPRRVFPHALTLIELFLLSTRIALSKLMTIDK